MRDSTVAYLWLTQRLLNSQLPRPLFAIIADSHPTETNAARFRLELTLNCNPQI
jgi:hypothetical protein